MHFKITAACLSTIAFATMPLMLVGQAVEEFDCPEDFAGIALSDRQKSQLQALEMQLHNTVDQIVPISAETETKIEQLEETFEMQIEALLSQQQQQRIEQLDIWAEEQEVAIVPELREDDELESRLTPEQEERLEAVEAAYEQRYLSLLTPEQRQQIEVLEDQLDAAIAAELPEPTAEQEARIEAAEASFGAGILQTLTSEQYQQFQRNLDCDL